MYPVMDVQTRNRLDPELFELGESKSGIVFLRTELDPRPGPTIFP
jgi:hypothetical protein